MTSQKTLLQKSQNGLANEGEQYAFQTLQCTLAPQGGGGGGGGGVVVKPDPS